MSGKSNSILKRQIEVREKLWPEVSHQMLWSRERVGFVTMPRAMPLILRIMDYMAGKGVPVSQVYLDIWCRAFDEGFIQITKAEEMAAYSGFSGQRAVRTWKDRVTGLSDLGFIRVKKGITSDVQFVLLLNPYHVVAKAYVAGNVPVELWTSLVVRCAEVGASDLDDLDEFGNLITKSAVVPTPPPPLPVSSS